MNDATAPNSGHAVLAANIQNADALYRAYMPFIRNGGLFVPTPQGYCLGDAILLLIRLLDTNEQLPVPSKVVWITPEGAEGRRPQGVGVQFQDDGVARAHIEIRLPAAADDPRPTYTV